MNIRGSKLIGGPFSLKLTPMNSSVFTCLVCCMGSKFRGLNFCLIVQKSSGPTVVFILEF